MPAEEDTTKDKRTERLRTLQEENAPFRGWKKKEVCLNSRHQSHGSAALNNNPASPDDIYHKTRRRAPTTSISEVGYRYICITQTQPLADIDTIKRCASDGSVPASHSFQSNPPTTKLCWPRPCSHFQSRPFSWSVPVCSTKVIRNFENLRFDLHR